MANPTQAQIDKLTTNSTRWDNIINGSAETTVALDTFTVKTVAGYLRDLQATNPRGAWGTGTVYALKDVVVETNVVYICTIAHTGGTFATDLAAGKWAVYQLDVTSAITFGDDFTVDTNTLHVDSINSRVGIGTTSPTAQFEIVASNSRKFQFDSGKTFLQGTNTAWANKYGFKATDGTDLGGFYCYGNATSLIYFNIGAAYNDGTFTILSSGNIGIGVTNPLTKLDVAGSTNDLVATFRSTTNDANASQVIIRAVDSDSSHHCNFKFKGYAFNFLNPSDVSLMTIDSTGSLGLGVITPNNASIIELQSTTKGFLPPRMTDTQRDAISTPPAGLIIYNTTDNKLNIYTTTWEQISSF